MTIIKIPGDCTKEEINKFHELVLKSGKVTQNGLMDRISNCQLLAFYLKSGVVVGISAIKTPSLRYKERVVADYSVPRKALELNYEVGYSYTEPEERRKGISSKLKKALLESFKPDKGLLFSTTAVSSSKKFLLANGFNNVGVSHDGENDTSIFYYEKPL